VGVALEAPRVVEAPPAPVVPTPSAPSVADRAAEEAAAALAAPHMMAAPVAGPGPAPSSVLERAQDEVDNALAQPVDVRPPAVELAAPAQSTAGSMITVPPPATSPVVVLPVTPVADAAERARLEAEAAAATPVIIVPPVPAAADERPADRAAAEVGAALQEGSVVVLPPPVPAEPAAEAAASAEATVPPEPAVETAAPAEPAAPAEGQAPAAVPEGAGTAEVPETAARPVEVAPVPAVPTIRVEPLAEQDDRRFSSGRVIIRRGDTLWDIAERVYGAGWRYPIIYRANRHRIVRPGLIYPGQVFDLPERPGRWR
jgi:nucleoid-associated protein YgaU